MACYGSLEILREIMPLEKVEVPAKKVVKFKVGRLMKERVGLK